MESSDLPSTKVNDLVAKKALWNLWEESEKAWLLEGQRQREHQEPKVCCSINSRH